MYFFQKEDKSQEIQKLETDISDLTNLFNDLDILVNSQSSILDNIETTLIDAEKSIDDAKIDLEKINNKKQTKKKCFFKIIGGTIIVIPIICLPFISTILGIKLLVGTLVGTTSVGTGIFIYDSKTSQSKKTNYTN